MPVLISMKFDGGYETFSAALNKELDHLKSFKGLWQKIIAWFESSESPILAIFKSQGQLIGGTWDNSPEYEKWKEKYWQQKRTENVPIPGISKQILTGTELKTLLDGSADGAIRIANDHEMVYGLSNDYTRKWQDERKVLDFYPAMTQGLKKLLTLFINEVKELGLQGE